VDQNSSSLKDGEEYYDEEYEEPMNSFINEKKLYDEIIQKQKEKSKKDPGIHL
jgi:hypothetical protein